MPDTAITVLSYGKSGRISHMTKNAPKVFSSGAHLHASISLLQIFFQCIRLVQFLPGQIQIVSAKMSVSGSLLVDRTTQI